MFDSPYNVIFRQRRKADPDSWYTHVQIYRFKTDRNHTYIVEIEEYHSNLYAIKFHLKAHSQSKHRYQLLTNFREANRVIGTAFNVLLKVFNDDPFASFVISGMPCVDSDDFKRYRIYTKLIQSKISPIKYEHRYLEEKRLYILVNRDYIETNNEESLLSYIYELAQNLEY